MTTIKKVNKQPTSDNKLMKNSWERRRVAKLNEAWSQLERCVPIRTFQKPTKLMILHAAMERISQLESILKSHDKEGSIEDSMEILMSQETDSEVKESPMVDHADSDPLTMIMEDTEIVEIMESDDGEDSDVTNFLQKIVECVGTKESNILQNPTYRPDEIIVDGHRSAYFEDTQRTRPQGSKVRVQSVGGNVHSSSANIPRTSQPAVAAVVSPPQQQSFVRPNEQHLQPRIVRPQPQQQLTRPASVRPQTRRPVPQPQQVTRPVPRPAAPKSHLAPQPAPVVAISKPRTASEKFLQCCKGRKVHNSCERICSFDVLSKKTLTGMFLGTDPCPQHHGLDLMQCAADSDDHTECCIDKEVDRTSAGKKCLGFCNMKPGITFQADVSMLPCWSVLNDIKQCFRENLERQLAASV